MSIARDANYAGLMEVPNLRRASLCELVYMMQDIDLDLLYHPGAVGINKTVYQGRLTTEIWRELQRRYNMQPLSPDKMPERFIIPALKERADIVDILEQFTDVFIHQGKWTYRCTLHGEDKHPSGVIYKDTKKAWCFACNTGGDVIDMVKLFNHCDTREALNYLGKFYGIQIK